MAKTSGTKTAFEVDKSFINYPALHCLFHGIDERETLWSRHGILELLTHNRPLEEVIDYMFSWTLPGPSLARCLSAVMSVQPEIPGEIIKAFTSNVQNPNRANEISGLLYIPAVIRNPQVEKYHTRDFWLSLYEALYRGLTDMCFKEQVSEKRLFMDHPGQEGESGAALRDGVASFFGEAGNTEKKVRNQQFRRVFQPHIRSLMEHEEVCSGLNEPLANLLEHTDHCATIPMYLLNLMIKEYEQNQTGAERITRFIR